MAVQALGEAGMLLFREAAADASPIRAAGARVVACVAALDLAITRKRVGSPDPLP
jgi:hypothetical protein